MATVTKLTPVEDWIILRTGYLIRGDDKYLARQDKDGNVLDIIGPDGSTHAEMKLWQMLVDCYDFTDARKSALVGYRAIRDRGLKAQSSVSPISFKGHRDLRG